MGSSKCDSKHPRSTRKLPCARGRLEKKLASPLNPAKYVPVRACSDSRDEDMAYWTWYPEGFNAKVCLMGRSKHEFSLLGRAYA